MARLLVLDDDLYTLESWAALLRDAGHDVDTFVSARRGIEALRGNHYDLVLADLFLADGDALELLEQIRETGRRVPVIIATGFGTIETAVAAMKRGATNYVLKPLVGDDLIRQIEFGLAEAAFKNARQVPHAHAAVKWAQAVVGLLEAREDTRTLGQWARSVGLSASTLRIACQMAGIPAKRALTLARLLRAVYQSRYTTWQPTQRLNITDPRTLHRMLASGGLSASVTSVSVGDLLLKQSLVTDADALAALRAALARTDPSLRLDRIT